MRTPRSRLQSRAPELARALHHSGKKFPAAPASHRAAGTRRRLRPFTLKRVSRRGCIRPLAKVMGLNEIEKSILTVGAWRRGKDVSNALHYALYCILLRCYLMFSLESGGFCPNRIMLLSLDAIIPPVGRS